MSVEDVAQQLTAFLTSSEQLVYPYVCVKYGNQLYVPVAYENRLDELASAKLSPTPIAMVPFLSVQQCRFRLCLSVGAVFQIQS